MKWRGFFETALKQRLTRGLSKAMTYCMSNRDWISYRECLGFSEEAFSEPKDFIPPGSSDTKMKELLDQQEKAKICQGCRLSETRKSVVFGEGSLNAKLMFVGEGPGADEDELGRPFVGAAGQLLNKMILAMGLNREEVYIANIVKCRPPQNRNPEPDEIVACSSYLHAQITTIQPEVVVCLGKVATQALLSSSASLGSMRGKFVPHEHHRTRRGDALPVLATFHPAYLLRNPADKKHAWEDLQKVMKRLNL